MRLCTYKSTTDVDSDKYNSKAFCIKQMRIQESTGMGFSKELAQNCKTVPQKMLKDVRILHHFITHFPEETLRCIAGLQCSSNFLLHLRPDPFQNIDNYRRITRLFHNMAVFRPIHTLLAARCCHVANDFTNLLTG